MEHMIKQYLEAGKIVGTHGVRGELRLEPWCDSAAFLAGLSRFFWDEKGTKEIELVSARPHKSMLLIKLRGVDTIEQGDTLRGKVLYLNRDDIALPAGRFFVQDLFGLKAIDADSGAFYGVLTDVIETGANDVYEVTSPEGKKYLVPAIRDVVVEIKPEEGKLLLRPIRGIFDNAD